jgi:hypothetical protein
MVQRALRGLRPIMTGVLAFSLAAGPVLAVEAEAQSASAIRGVIYQMDEKTKLAGARITAIDVRTGKPYVSNITGENGAYEIVGVPEGTYDIAIEVAGEVFVTDNLVDLARNQRVALSYSVQPLRPANRKIAGLAEPKGSATPIGPTPNAGAAGLHRNFWRRPEGIGLISILGIGAIVAAANSGGNDSNASPSSP